jgi:hypothetical protein
MKKKSGHRRRTKVVRRSRKNSRRTVKRKSLGKGRRRPTRRYSRVQRGGENEFLEQGIRYEWLGDNDRALPSRQSYANALRMYNLEIKEGKDDMKKIEAMYRLGVMHEHRKGAYGSVNDMQKYEKQAMQYYQAVVDSKNYGVTSKFVYDPVTKAQAEARLKLDNMVKKLSDAGEEIWW